MPHIEHQLIAGALERLDTLFMEIVERSDSQLLMKAWERGAEGNSVKSSFRAGSQSSLPGEHGRSFGAGPVVVRRVWWQRPDRLREEILFESELLVVNVCCGATAYSYVPRDGILYTNNSSMPGKRLRSSNGVPIPTLPTVQSGLEQITLLQPPFRNPGWEVTVADGERQYAGRSALSIVARRSQARTIRAGWQWDGIDQFTAVIDQQLGLPFQVAAMVAGQEAAVFSARAFRIDEPIAGEVFQLTPPKGAFIALVHPNGS